MGKRSEGNEGAGEEWGGLKRYLRVVFSWFWNEDGLKRGVGARWGPILSQLAKERKCDSQKRARLGIFLRAKWG